MNAAECPIPFGYAYIYEDAGRIVRCDIAFKKKPVRCAKSPVLDDAKSQLEEYFKKERREFTVPLGLSGTDMQIAVYETLIKVPYGSVISYGELAWRSGYPRAARAVGTAMKNNPLALFVPCHRVIKADGGLGGYFAGGLEVKKKLLKMESENV